MARQISLKASIKTGYSSPEGFWPLQRKGDVHSAHSPTWEVPNRRKPRNKNKKKSEFYFYDTNEEDIHFSRGGEVTTKNRFSLLEDTPCYGKKESLTRSEIKEDTPHKEVSPDWTDMQEKKNLFYNKYDDFLSDNIFQYDSTAYRIDNYNMYLYSNKYNLCSGYFPDFIFIPPVFENSFIDTRNPRYYPLIYNGKYTKQISN